MAKKRSTPKQPAAKKAAPKRAPRCDCPAHDGPHTHEPGGPEPLEVKEH